MNHKKLNVSKQTVKKLLIGIKNILTPHSYLLNLGRSTYKTHFSKLDKRTQFFFISDSDLIFDLITTLITSGVMKKHGEEIASLFASVLSESEIKTLNEIYQEFFTGMSENPKEDAFIPNCIQFTTTKALKNEFIFIRVRITFLLNSDEPIKESLQLTQVLEKLTNVLNVMEECSRLLENVDMIARGEYDKCVDQLTKLTASIPSLDIPKHLPKSSNWASLNLLDNQKSLKDPSNIVLPVKPNSNTAEPVRD